MMRPFFAFSFGILGTLAWASRPGEGEVCVHQGRQAHLQRQGCVCFMRPGLWEQKEKAEGKGSLLGCSGPVSELKRMAALT